MRLTQEQREEGRRLLAVYRTGTHEQLSEGRIVSRLLTLLLDNAEALLADREAVDVEAIKREAVREFALRLAANVWESSGVDANAVVIVLRVIKKLAAARGATLESERGA